MVEHFDRQAINAIGFKKHSVPEQLFRGIP